MDIYFKNTKMKLVSKIICWILWILICFILINLLIWSVKYWWIQKYSTVLNNTNRQESISEISLFKPKTWVSVFYKTAQDETMIIDEFTQIEDSLPNENSVQKTSNVDSVLNEYLSWDTPRDSIQQSQPNRNPYDPDYEDEFNSFFGTTAEKTWEIISVEEIEDLWEVWFNINGNTDN